MIDTRSDPSDLTECVTLRVKEPAMALPEEEEHEMIWKRRRTRRLRRWRNEERRESGTQG
ncbi:hypothetical protein PROFUN_14572 [Planoprotostelium fungivorum]|uniref:Uncharacterized protein n=1 Tax=Planoprotostelium fungivorum TaxID=1890364 RepID=A0A2P6MZA7_9EUKA|nr:hypothetical protein PROFUN_14572 [Planoprotostelium fungivorum]